MCMSVCVTECAQDVSVHLYCCILHYIQRYFSHMYVENIH